MTKLCASCKIDKGIEEFSVRKRMPDGRYYYCKECDRSRAAIWRANRGDIHRAGSTKWRLANPTAVKQMNLEWRNKNAAKVKADKIAYYRQNADKVNAKKKEWYEANKGRIVHKVGQTKANRLRAAPPWLTDDHWTFMEITYRMSQELTRRFGFEFHVDHIHPMVGKNFCGLHTPWNLQVIPAVENMRKGNRLAA